MGGGPMMSGGAIRTAAKVSGFGVFNTVTRPASSVADGGVMGSRSVMIDHLGSTQKAVRIADDWNMAPGEDYFGSGESVGFPSVNRRLVFGSPPTLEEAHDATSEPKEAIDGIYFSSWESSESVKTPDSQVFEFTAMPHLEPAEVNDCVTSERPVIKSMSKRALQAFMLLKENPAAQNVVASIACDTRVWDAVLQNEALQGYVMSGTGGSDHYEDQQSAENLTDSSGSSTFGNHKGDRKFWFSDFAEKIKKRLQEAVNDLTDFIQNHFDSPGSKGALEFMEANQGSFIGGSLMALAMMVIMVVLARRF